MISNRDLPPKFLQGKDFQSVAGRGENGAFGRGVSKKPSAATSAILSVTWITYTTIR